MPELPEVETVCRALQKAINQQKILTVILRQASLRWPIPPTLPLLLSNQYVNSISRRGKYIIISFLRGSLIIHLGMSGTIRLLSHPIPMATAHDHLDITFNHDITLRYRDPRRFGAILWTENDIAQHPLLSKLGPEPLTEDFNSNYLLTQTCKRKINIKSLVMNSQIIAGVGNIYANESLFYSGIHPLRESYTLDLCACQKLVNNIKQVLQRAIQAGGTTLNDFFQSDGRTGYFQQQLAVYGRAGQPCLQCHTVLVESITINQRSSFYCPHCQQ